MHGLSRERRGGETDPELRGAPAAICPSTVSVFAVDNSRRSMSGKAWMRFQRVGSESGRPDRGAISPRVDRERRQKVGQLPRTPLD